MDVPKKIKKPKLKISTDKKALANVKRAKSIEKKVRPVAEAAELATDIVSAKGLAKLGVTAAKKAFAKGFAPAMGIIRKEGQELYKTANKLFESGKGQPAIIDAIKKLRLKEQKGLNKPSVTGLSKEELDEAAALSITDPKQGRIFRKGGPAKGESAKLALVKASQGTKQGSKQTTKGLHKTNKEKREVEEGTSTASALVRTKKKAAQGFFNKEGTRRIKKASEKELTENEWKALIEEETKRKK
jgi:hypothetical protein